MKRFSTNLLIIALTVTATAKATSFQATEASVTFGYKVTFIPVEGTAEGATGSAEVDFNNLDKTTATVSFDLKTLKTGIALRDQHAKDALGVETSPNAIFKLKSFTGDKTIADGQAVTGSVTGEFTLKGITKSMVAPVTLVRKGQSILVNTTFAINPQAHGVKVKGGDNNTKITATFTLSPK